MKKESEILSRVEALPHPRHLFVLPPWADPLTLDRLIKQGYLTCNHSQRDERGALQLVMNLELTARGQELARPKEAWSILALKGSLAGASLTAMSLVILYLG